MFKSLLRNLGAKYYKKETMVELIKLIEKGHQDALHLKQGAFVVFKTRQEAIARYRAIRSALDPIQKRTHEIARSSNPCVISPEHGWASKQEAISLARRYIAVYEAMKSDYTKIKDEVDNFISDHEDDIYEWIPDSASNPEYLQDVAREVYERIPDGMELIFRPVGSVYRTSRELCGIRS